MTDFQLELLWEPDSPYFPDSVLAESAVGNGYDKLSIEQDHEGWHGILFLSMVDEDEVTLYGDSYLGGQELELQELELVDETMAPTREDAITWCETKDQQRTQQQGEQEDGY